MFYLAVAVVAMSSAFSFTSCNMICGGGSHGDEGLDTVIVNKDSVDPAAPADTNVDKKDATAEEAPAAEQDAPVAADQKTDAAPAK